MKLTSFLTRFISDRRGVAAVEMALVAPAIAGLAFVSINLWEATQRRQSMDEALRVASQYYLNGGLTDADAKAVGMSAWKNAPADAAMSTVRSCRCGVVTVACTTLCTNNVPPSVFVTITASGSTPGATFQSTQMRAETVRVR